MVVFAGFVLIVAAGSLTGRSGAPRKEYQAYMRAARADQSICTFARSFDCRGIDTWIIRAAYEQLSEDVGFPIRAADHLQDDLRYDADDLEWLVVEAVAEQSRRSLEDPETNWRFGSVKSVRDLVEALAYQPREARIP